MKAKEIRSLTASEIQAKVADAYHALFNLRFQHATGQLESPMKLRQQRRDLARLQTILKEKSAQGASLNEAEKKA
ncbi:MAG: 50S ribosomal protein L29 [Deltaproteobacteria bacterium]|nr:50S ribosomal protein L29 [Deltaproteobacteria bacterium]